MQKLSFVVGREESFHNVQTEVFRLKMKRKSPSKCILVVYEVTQRESRATHGSVFHGKSRERGETSVKVRKCWG